MSNIDLIVEERASEVGNFLVGRLLPFRQKRAVGPFVFIDHMGPMSFSEKENMDVGPHPHIGLCTLTYLFEGSIRHKDSLGSDVEIIPGAVNLMVAGKGVVHSERTPERLRNVAKVVHGFQIWIALPVEEEQRQPSFHHIEASDIPQWEEGNVSIRLIAGNLFGHQSPVPVFSPLYFIELTASEDSIVNIGEHLFGESALYVLEGEVVIDGNHFGGKQLLITKNAELCSFTMKKDSVVCIFGGTPLTEEHFIHWNFVSSDRALIEKAREDWRAQRFDSIVGETDFVPLPDFKF